MAAAEGGGQESLSPRLTDPSSVGAIDFPAGGASLHATPSHPPSVRKKMKNELDRTQEERGRGGICY